jgi:predicted dehydrogenase
MPGSTTGPIRSGIVGTGFMADVHAHAVRAAGGVVTAVATRRPQDAGQIASALGVRRVVGSVAELAASPDVDVIHVCSPNTSHREMTETAVAAGKSVICEKPLATSADDARLMRQRAKDAGVVTAVPFVYRFYPMARQLRARIDAGEAGRLWLLHGSYLQDWLAGADLTNWRVDPAAGGPSRAFGDIGVHWCDLLEFTTGQRITRVNAHLGTAYDQRPGTPAELPQTEDGLVLMFQTSGGAIGSLVVSQVSPGRKNRLWLSLDGTDASLSFNQEAPDTLWIGGVTQNRTIVAGTQTTGPAAAYSRLPAGHPQGYQDAFTAFITDVHSAIRGQKPDGLPTFDDGVRAAVLTEAVLESARHQSWVDVPSATT